MSGMWIFPVICIFFMTFFMFFFFRRRRDGNKFCWPFYNSEKNIDGSSESAIEILKKRYAKGEITKEEYDRIKKDLLND